jgi:hypothetical protein
MNLKESTTVNFVGRKLKVLFSKLIQNAGYYPIKHNSKTLQRLRRHHQGMW